MSTIDEDVMREEIEGFIENELHSSDFGSNVNTFVWEAYFGEGIIADGVEAEAAKVYNAIYKECIDKMIKALKSV